MRTRLEMPELLERWSDLLIDELPPTEQLSGSASASCSVLRAPAHEDAIASAEDRLGCRLPPSYREFLEVSDGAYASLYGATTEYTARFATGAADVGFLPVGETAWLRDVDPSGAQMWGAPDPDDVERPAESDGEEILPWSPIARGLTIAVDFRPGTTCLVPFDGREEWQVWNIHKETSLAFRSFRSMLEHQVSIREPVTTTAELEYVLRQAWAGDQIASRRIGRTTAADAVPVLAAVVASDPTAKWGVPHLAARALGRIGTSEALDALVAVNPPRTDEVLAQAGNEQARDLLATRGSYLGLARLGDDRAAPIAAVALRAGIEHVQDRRRALDVLGRSGDASYCVVLRPILRSEDAYERLSAAEAMLALGFDEGRDVLTLLLDDPRASHAARLVLERIDRDRPA